MQGELNRVNRDLKNKIEGAAAASTAMAMMPHADKAVMVGAGTSGKEAAIAIGFSDSLNDKVKYKFGVAADTDGGTQLGAGVSFSLN